MVSNSPFLDGFSNLQGYSNPNVKLNTIMHKREKIITYMKDNKSQKMKYKRDKKNGGGVEKSGKYL